MKPTMNSPAQALYSSDPSGSHVRVSRSRRRAARAGHPVCRLIIGALA